MLDESIYDEHVMIKKVIYKVILINNTNLGVSNI